MGNDYHTPDSLYLCIDQGGHASRALVFNQRGELVEQAFCDISAKHPQNDFVEYDAVQLLQSIRQSVDEVIDMIGSQATKIVAAGLATQRSNIACWDRITGEALSPVISWQDRRAYKWLQQFEDDAERIHKATGLFLSPHYGASKLHWCLENLPEVQTALQEGRLCFGPMASYFVYHLCEEHPLLADPVNASRTQLWDLDSKNWHPTLLSEFDIPADALPECVGNQHLFGHIVSHDHHIPLQLVTGDQSAAMYAYGQLQPDTAYINMGTGAFLSRPSGYARLYGRRLLTSIIFQNQNRSEYVLEGTVNGAGSALQWFEEEFQLENIADQLEDWLNKPSPSLLFLNGVSGLGAPFWVADFSSSFLGEGSVEEKAVAVAESIGFLLQANLDEMHKLASPPEQIQISGGLSHVNGLCQRIADLSGLPVYRPLECEATARGLAYLLADSPAKWPENGIGDWFKSNDNKALCQRYSSWHEKMCQSMRAFEKPSVAEKT